MFGFLKKLFGFQKKRIKKPPTKEEIDLQFDSLLKSLKDKISKFLITRSKSSGEIKKTKEWTLVKNNGALFKLESSDYSILINTEGFLARKEGKLTGLLRMRESDLCRVVLDSATLAQFVGKAEGLRAEYMNLLPAESGREADYPSVDDLIHWQPFDVYQMIARNTPNTLVHVLIHGSEKTCNAVKAQISRRKKELLIVEMESLLSPGSDPQLNPGSRIFGLTQFDDALYEFRKHMQEYLKSSVKKGLKPSSADKKEELSSVKDA